MRRLQDIHTEKVLASLGGSSFMTESGKVIEGNYQRGDYAPVVYDRSSRRYLAVWKRVPFDPIPRSKRITDEGGLLTRVQPVGVMATYDFEQNRIFFRNRDMKFYISLNGIVNNKDIDEVYKILKGTLYDGYFGTWGVGTTLEAFSLLKCDGRYGAFVIRKNTPAPEIPSPIYELEYYSYSYPYQTSEFFVYKFKILGPKPNGTSRIWVYDNLIWRSPDSPYGWGEYVSFSEEDTYEEYDFIYEMEKLPEMDDGSNWGKWYRWSSGWTPINYCGSLSHFSGDDYIGTARIKNAFCGFAPYSINGEKIDNLSQLRYAIATDWPYWWSPLVNSDIRMVSWFDSKIITGQKWRRIQLSDIHLLKNVATFFAFSNVAGNNQVTDVLSVAPIYYASPPPLKWAKWYVTDINGNTTYLYDDATVLPRNPTYYFYSYTAEIGFPHTPLVGRKGGGVFLKQGETIIKDRVMVTCGTPSGDNTVRGAYRINGTWYLETNPPEENLPRGEELLRQGVIDYKTIPWSFDIYFGDFCQLRAFGVETWRTRDFAAIEYFHGKVPLVDIANPIQPILGYSRTQRVLFQKLKRIPGPPYFEFDATKDFNNFISDFAMLGYYLVRRGS